jgi:hypothetical protein
MRLVMFVLLVACGERGAPSVVEPARPAMIVTSAEPADASVPVAGLDAGTAPGALLDAGAAPDRDAGAASCFCFSWVHLDENGQYCFPAKPACDAEFNAFGRDMKRPCTAESQRCESYACRGGGKQCFRL